MKSTAERPFDRAARDTRSALSSLRYRLLALAVAAGAALVPGSNTVLGVLAGGVVVLLVYVWNLVRAPYRLLAEAREREHARAEDPGLQARAVASGPVGEVRVENVGSSVRLCSVLIEEITGLAAKPGLIETPYYAPWLTGVEALGDYGAHREVALRPGEIARFWLISWLYPRQASPPHNLFYVLQCSPHQFPHASDNDDAPRFSFLLRVLSDRDRPISRRVTLVGDAATGQLKLEDENAPTSG